MEYTIAEQKEVLKTIIHTCRTSTCKNCQFYVTNEGICGFMTWPEKWRKEVVNIKKEAAFEETDETIKEDHDELTKDDIINAGRIISKVCSKNEKCETCPFRYTEVKNSCIFDNFYPKNIEFGIGNKNWSAVEKIKGD